MGFLIFNFSRENIKNVENRREVDLQWQIYSLNYQMAVKKKCQSIQVQRMLQDRLQSL